MEVVNIKDGKKKATRRYVLHIIFIILLALLTISGAILLLLFSPHKYLTYAIIDVLIVSIVIIFFIFYFVNIFPLVYYYYSFYKGMNNFSLERARYLTFVEEKERKDINKVSHRTLEFSYKEGNNTYRENIYVLDNDELSFRKGEIIKVTTYHNVLIRFEDENYATNE